MSKNLMKKKSSCSMSKKSSKVKSKAWYDIWSNFMKKISIVCWEICWKLLTWVWHETEESLKTEAQTCMASVLRCFFQWSTSWYARCFNSQPGAGNSVGRRVLRPDPEFLYEGLFTFNVEKPFFVNILHTLKVVWRRTLSISTSTCILHTRTNTF